MVDNRVTNTISPYSIIGAAEDVSNEIWTLSPTKTPFINSIKKASAEAVYSEWLKKSLNAASTSNAHQMGEDISYDAAVEPVRLGNRVQVMLRSSIVDDLANKIHKYGRSSESMMQIVDRGLEVKRDMEKIILNPQAKVTGAAGTAPKLAGFPSWILSNYSKNDGTLATGDGTDTYVNGAGLRGFTEAQLKTVLASCFTNSGDQPDMILMNGTYKQVMSTFTGNANRTVDAKGKQLISAIDFYVGDFGTLKCMADVFAPANMVLVANTDHWELRWLQPMTTKNMAPTGLADKRVVWCAVTLAALNEAGSGAIFDLS